VRNEERVENGIRAQLVWRLDLRSPTHSECDSLFYPSLSWQAAYLLTECVDKCIFRRLDKKGFKRTGGLASKHTVYHWFGNLVTSLFFLSEWDTMAAPPNDGRPYKMPVRWRLFVKFTENIRILFELSYI
jgi:hypothetical protein